MIICLTVRPWSIPAPAIGTVISSVKGVVGNYFDYKIYLLSINDIVFGDGGGGTDYIDASILEVQSLLESETGDDCYIPVCFQVIMLA